jgi:hypothetical protein
MRNAFAVHTTVLVAALLCISGVGRAEVYDWHWNRTS